MRNKLAAVILILAISVSVLWVSNPWGSVEARADIYKGGFSITASKYDDSGIALDTEFYLTSQNPVSLDYLKENLCIRGHAAPEISELPDGRFLIKPAEKLEKGRLYVIDIKTPDRSTVSFAFQTAREFAVVGSLPQDMSSSVPVDTGIEIYFTYNDVEDIEKYFEISPKVEGRFEEHGYARCFVPKKLEPGTIYTVTVKKGLRAAKGALALEEDYTFSFETSSDSSLTADPSPGSLGISDIWFDFSTREQPVIPFYIYLTGMRGQKDVPVKASVYRFPNEDALINAIRERDRVPSWAWYSYSRLKTDVSSLEKVMEFTQYYNLDSWDSRYIMLPESLPHGFYIIELTCEDLSAQAFIQSSDTAAFFMEDSSGGLFWVNNLVTGEPSVSAVIKDTETGRTARTDRKGLARLEGTSAGKDLTRMDFYKITTSDGRVSLLNAGYLYVLYQNEYDSQGLNWHYLQTDRNLYKPDDLVQFWGFVKSRIDDTSPDKVTIELSEGGYFSPMYDSFVRSFLPFVMGKPMATLALDVKDGFFSGELQLPILDPGSYSLVVRSGSKILASTYVQVDNYVKPQYQLAINSDKKAVFAGEKISFTVSATFFDGTPVSNVPIRYSINGYMNHKAGEGVTDQNGILTVEYIPEYHAGMQGANYFSFSVSTTLPEIGEIYQYHNFRVFANHTELVASGEIKDGNATVSVIAHQVELDTLNDEDPSNDKHLGRVVPGHSAEVRVYRITWDKIEIGEDYDFINKVVRKRYEYRERKTAVTNSMLITDADGRASFAFPVDKDLEGYYIAEITSRDQKDRGLKYNINLYDRSTPYYPSTSDNYYYLKSEKERYISGELVNLEFYKGEEPVSGYRTLFVEARNGILGAEVKDQPVYSKPFDAALSPNYYVDGVMFTGTAYIRSGCTVAYDYEEKKLTIKVETDKESYKPGESCTVTITASDLNGNPVEAMVNISLIDEALLKLSEQYIDPLKQLYSWIGSGITRYSTSRRNNPIYPARAEEGFGVVGEAADTAVQKADAAPVPAPSAAPEAYMDGSISDGVALRSDFRDTACFETVRLDENGKGKLTFTLPDSVTSFKLTAAAISNDLHAGSEIASTRVSMPFFINDAMSLTYLSGDKPYIGLTAYGQELEEGEDVHFEIRCKELDNYVLTASAKAFQRVNVPLPRLPEGTYDLEIYARSKSGFADGIKRTIRVYDTYRIMEASSSKELVPGVKVDAGDSGLTTIIITDKGRGRLIAGLHGLAWGYGHRLDQKLTAYHARKLLNELLDDQDFLYESFDPDAPSYRNPDGGYGILPYSTSDIRMSALLTPWLAEVTDTTSLKLYFYNALLTDETINAPALYGLVALGEPVLAELETALNTENLSLTDYMFVGMAYRMLGETGIAMEIYNTRIKGHLEIVDPYIRVRVKNGDTDTSLEQTALLAAFTAGLGLEESDKMHAYVTSRYSKNVYTGVEQLIYLSERLKAAAGDSVEFDFTYDGRSFQVKLENGGCELIRIPSVKAGEFKVTRVQGNASIMSIYKAPLGRIAESDSNVTITRRYFNAITGEETTTFKPNDIVKVQIDYTIKDAAIDNIYEISDYAPSGLKPISNPWSYGITRDFGWFYRNIDGQKVTFVVGKWYDKTHNYKPLTYYARVAAPGEYTAEGTVAQGSIVKSSLTVNDSTVIRILP